MQRWILAAMLGLATTTAWGKVIEDFSAPPRPWVQDGDKRGAGVSFEPAPGAEEGDAALKLTWREGRWDFQELYYAAPKSIGTPFGETRISLTLRAMATVPDAVHRIAVRLKDGSNEFFDWGKGGLAFKPGEWQTITIDLALEKLSGSWGGNNNKFPDGDVGLAGFAVGIRGDGAVGSLYIDDVTILVEPMLQAQGVDQFFVTPDAPATLRFAWDVSMAGTALSYALQDYQGQPAGEGRSTVAEDGTVAVTVTLPAGYYELNFPEKRQTFGICALPAFTGARDPFFGIDSALTELVPRWDMAAREGLIAILGKGGVAASRERLNTSALSSKADVWNWEGGVRNEQTRQAYAAAEVGVLELLHGPPVWTRAKVGGKPTFYSENLPGLAHFGRGLLERWGAWFCGLEVWNEPDMGVFGAADEYMPMVKTLAWAAQQAGGTVPVGGLAFSALNKPFLKACVNNGLLDCVHYVSWHLYGSADQMEGVVADYRELFGRIPLWLTEYGHAWTRGPGRPPRGEANNTAVSIVRNTIEARACGIARVFPFVYVHYEEGAKSFGMMGREHTFLSPMVVYLNAVRLLSNRPYLGDVAGVEGRPIRVFGDAESAVLVLRPGADGAFALPADIAVQAVWGIDGRRLDGPASDGRVATPDPVVYVVASAASVRPHLETETAAMALTRAGDMTATPAPLSPLVLRPTIKDERLVRSKVGVQVSKADSVAFTLDMEIQNLGETPQEARLALAGPSSLKLPLPSGQSFALPPQGRTNMAWQVGFSDAVDFLSDNTIAISGTDGDGRPILPLAFTVAIKGELEDYLRGGGQTQRVTIGPCDQNINNGRMTFSTSPEGVWRVDMAFNGKGSWAFPRFDFPRLSGVNEESLLILRMRCERYAEVTLMAFEENGAAYYTPGSVINSNGEWETAVLRHSDFVPEPNHPKDENQFLDWGQVRRFTVGTRRHMSKQSNENVIEVSDFLFLTPEKPASAE